MTEYLMILDPFPSSKLNIKSYLKKEIEIYDDLRKSEKIKCDSHGIFCPVYSELIMIKDFQRDDDLYYKVKMDMIQSNLLVFDNSHITNLIYAKLSGNKIFYKKYMKEFKKRRRNWNYSVLSIKNKEIKLDKNEQKILETIPIVLKQCQINVYTIEKENNTYLKKEIKNFIKNIRG
jgi:hypothetical protein